MSDFLLPPRLKDYARMATGFGGGAFSVVAGLIGYDLGRRTTMHGMPEATRWIGGPIWTQTAIGAGLLLFGVYSFWKFRRAAN